MEKIKKECSKFTYPKTNFDCEYISEEITEYLKTSLKIIIKVNYPKIKERMKKSEQPKTITIKRRTLKI